MLNPAYVRLIQNQKERELLTAIEMKHRCIEGYACEIHTTPWYARFARIFARPRAQKVPTPACCKAC